MAKGPVIRRYLNNREFAVLKGDLAHLIDKVRNSNGEIALLLRDGYFNLYHRGNSIAKVTFLKSGELKLEIHRCFVAGTLGQGTQPADGYYSLTFAPKEVGKVFKTEHLKKWCRNVANVNYSEELAFEQMLITDNPPAREYIIIDRQVSDHVFRKRMDMLALRREKTGEYSFEIIEVKMGNNPELHNGKVLTQIQDYVGHVVKHIQDYRACYEKNVAQQRALGLLPGCPQAIMIGSNVRGLIAVGGYSQQAKGAVAKLRTTFAANKLVRVKQFRNNLV
jgi:hypothetical protein